MDRSVPGFILRQLPVTGGEIISENGSFSSTVDVNVDFIVDFILKKTFKRFLGLSSVLDSKM